MRKSVLTFLALILAAALLLCGCAPSNETPTTPPVTPVPSTIPAPLPSLPPEDSTFSVHFIDVGQADAALVECDGHYMLIDGGNKEDSNVIYSVLNKANVPYLDIVVGTHGHEDHIGGLPGAFAYTTADLTLCSVTNYDSSAFDDFAESAAEKGGGIVVPNVGDTYELGSADILVVGVNSGEDTNDTSIVLKIQYGNTSFLFTGDAERPAEEVILSSGYDISATVLKVGHHGAATSTSYPFLYEVAPQYAVISVGEDNSYGHPTEETLSKLRDADVEVYRTDLQGDIFCTSDGTSVSFTSAKNADADTLSPVGPNSTQPENEEIRVDFTYILNINSGKFHNPDCSAVENMSHANKAEDNSSREELIARGYSPCGICKP